jgi:predicted transcriptional regulator
MAQKPTDAELAILNVLWQRGPSTVREVMDALSTEKPTGYTTVLKLLQIMVEKRLVKRDESRRTHVYRSAVPAERTQRKLVRELMDRAFQGSAQKLVMQALADRRVSQEELEAIRSLLDDLKEQRK